MEHSRIVIDPAICHGKPVVAGTRMPVSMVLGSPGACPSNRRVAIPARRDDFWLLGHRRVTEHRGDNPVVGWRHWINHRIIIRCSTSNRDDGVPDTDGTPRSRAAEGGQKARRPAGGPEMPRLLCCRISQTHYPESARSSAAHTGHFRPIAIPAITRTGSQPAA